MDLTKIKQVNFVDCYHMEEILTELFPDRDFSRIVKLVQLAESPGQHIVSLALAMTMRNWPTISKSARIALLIHTGLPMIVTIIIMRC